MTKRKVIVSDVVRYQIRELELFLKNDLKLSKKNANSRTEKIGVFLKSLGIPVDYPLCRFKRWNVLGYRCAVFEKDWVFAYEIVPQGIIVRDMSHTSLLIK